MKNGNLFHREEQVLARAGEIEKAPPRERDELLAEYQNLAKEYAKLYRQTKSLVHISDMMQKDLNVLNEKLNEANAAIKEKNAQLQEFSDRLTQALQSSQKKYRDIFEHAVEGIFRVSKGGVIYEANAAYARILGYASPEELCREVRDTTTLYVDSRERENLLQRLRKEGHVKDVTLHLKRRDGTDFWASLSARALKNADNEIDYYEGLLADITERVQVERAERERQAAEAASQAKTRFLAKMSHEIRTPMNAILGMAEILLRAELTVEQREYLDVIHESGEHLLGVINDIMDFAKLESKNIRLDVQDFTLRETVDTVLKSIRVLAAGKGIAVNLHMSPELPEYLRGDPGRLRQILNNLLGNAIKFTERGVVALVVTLAQEAHAAHNEDQGVQLLFSVKDTGIGIPSEEQSTIFQDFVQSDDAIFRKYGGTGLGLAITRELVELMGGVIWLKSEYGRGSEFFFTCRFGMGKKPTAARDMETWAGKLPSTPLKVLVVEDSPSNLMLVRHYLESLGHAVFHAPDGLQALQALAEDDSYQLVLMDVELPNLNGVETTRRIRAGLDGVRTPDIPIVAMTAHALEEARKRCIDVGMNAYVSKPLKRESLYRGIVEALAPAGLERRKRAAGMESTPPPLLDLNAAGAFQGLSPEEIKALFPTAFLELQKGMRTLGQAMEQGDFKALRRTAHTLKTVAASIGAGILRQRMLDLEQFSSPENERQARELFANAQQDMEQLTQRARELGLL